MPALMPAVPVEALPDEVPVVGLVEDADVPIGEVLLVGLERLEPDDAAGLAVELDVELPARLAVPEEPVVLPLVPVELELATKPVVPDRSKLSEPAASSTARGGMGTMKLPPPLLVVVDVALLALPLALAEAAVAAGPLLAVVLGPGPVVDVVLVEPVPEDEPLVDAVHDPAVPPEVPVVLCAAAGRTDARISAAAASVGMKSLNLIKFLRVRLDIARPV